MNNILTTEKKDRTNNGVGDEATISRNMSLNQLLKKTKTYDSYFTHVSMGITGKGKYNFLSEDFNRFYQLYDYKKLNGIAEKPQHYSMLRFDFDIKYKIDDYKSFVNKENKFYTLDEIKYTIRKINKEIKNTTELCNNDDLTCCLFEKDIYQKNDSYMSGGLHLQYPKLFITIEHMTTIISKIKDDIFKETGLVFDTGVYKNPWLIYGSSKQSNLKPYILTKIFNSCVNEMTLFETFKNYELFDYNENKIIITPENIDNLLPQIFSINPFNRATTDQKISSLIQPVVEKTRDKKINDNRDIEEKLVECRKLMPLLSHKRVDEYHDWMTLGWILYSIGNGCNEAFDLWNEKSQDSEKHDPVECEYQWSKMKVGNYTIGTLKMYAKEDNPEEYEKLYKKKDSYPAELVFVDNDIIECGEKIVEDFTHNNLAKIYSEYSKGEIFFTTGYGWIIFDKNTRTWSYNNDKVSLIYPISSFFCNIMKEYSSYFFNKNNDLKLSKQEEEEFLKKIKGMTKMKREVGNSSFISGVIAQIQSILTKPNEFIDNFDNKPNLFAFSDGKCIDLLNGGKVREIVKEDFIITTTGYAYPERNEIFIKKVNDILNSLTDDPEQIKSIKSLMCLGLWGENTNEIFAQFIGTGGNGKGLLDTGMKKVYGTYYQAINPSQLTEYEKDNQRANSELASCRFARVVMAVEPADSSNNGKNTTLKVPTLKKWTGRDIIKTRFLHKDQFSYTAKFTLMMQLNDQLDLSSNDDGIKRRMKIVELPFSFVENKGQPLKSFEFYRDESLKSLISTHEYRDALFFILLDSWLKNNGKFYESEKVKSYTNEFFENQNPVKLWFNQHYENDDNSKISGNDMFNQFKIYDYNSTLNMMSFGRLLKECCKSKKTTGKIMYFCKRKPFENNDDRFNGVPL